MKLYRQVPTDAGDTAYELASNEDVFTAAKTAVLAELPVGEVLDRAKFRDLLPALLGGDKTESFWVAHLDNSMRLLSFEKVADGTHDRVAAFPRELVRRILKFNTSNVILIHNHPGGPAKPSDQDTEVLGRLNLVAELVGADLIDAFIVGANEVVSLREMANEHKKTVVAQALEYITGQLTDEQKEAVREKTIALLGREVKKRKQDLN